MYSLWRVNTFQIKNRGTGFIEITPFCTRDNIKYHGIFKGLSFLQCIFKKYIHCKYSNRKENSLFLRQQLGNFSVRSLIVVFSKFYSCTCLPNTVLCEQISDSLWMVVKTDNCLILFDNHVQMLCIRVSIYDVFLWVDTTPFILSCYLLNF